MKKKETERGRERVRKGDGGRAPRAAAPGGRRAVSAGSRGTERDNKRAAGERTRGAQQPHAPSRHVTTAGRRVTMSHGRSRVATGTGHLRLSVSAATLTGGTSEHHEFALHYLSLSSSLPSPLPPFVSLSPNEPLCICVSVCGALVPASLSFSLSFSVFLLALS